MREDWPRSRPVLDLDASTVEGLIAPLFPGARIIEMSAVTGGLTNSNFRLRLAGRPGALLLRFYQRSGALAHQEMALCHKVSAQVPVPAYLHYAPENPVTGHAFAVIEWIEAKPLQEVLPHLGGGALADIGLALGRTLASLHGYGYPHFGYLDADLQVKAPMDLSGQGLVDYLNYCLVEGLAGERLGPELSLHVIAFAKREGHRIEAWENRACLVHGDFNISNILVAPTHMGAWRVAAIIDWEYAFAAAPGFDFGILLRPPLDAAAEFAASLEQGYRAAGGDMPADWQRIAKITDLFSFADVLHHPETSGAVIADMKAAIRRLVGG
jgi:aminoglycoside phosphotransferase (APT) family kinase protein